MKLFAVIAGVFLGICVWKAQASTGGESSVPYRDHPITRLMKKDDLQGLILAELRVCRHAVYARRGKIFAEPDLESSFAEREWYRPDPKYSDKRLSNLDKKNIAFIAKQEKRKGGLKPTAALTSSGLASSPVKAMKNFIQCVRRRDSKSALVFVPRSGLRFRNTIGGYAAEAFRTDRNIQPYSQLKRSRNWANYIVYADVTDQNSRLGLGGVIRRRGGDKWKRVAPTAFTLARQPEGFANHASIYILWGVENKKWVIAEIGYPRA
jgi:hypothetical protein